MTIDSTRWNTEQVLNAGVLNRPSPTSRKPKDAVLAEVDEDDLSEATLLAGFAAGGLNASMYYGCWRVWKTPVGFSGELMQYRTCTDAFDDLPLAEAFAKAREWAAACYG